MATNQKHCNARFISFIALRHSLNLHMLMILCYLTHTHTQSCMHPQYSQTEFLPGLTSSQIAPFLHRQTIPLLFWKTLHFLTVKKEYAVVKRFIILQILISKQHLLQLAKSLSENRALAILSTLMILMCLMGRSSKLQPRTKAQQ